MKKTSTIIFILLVVLLLGAGCSKTTTEKPLTLAVNQELSNSEGQPTVIPPDTDHDGLSDEQELTIGTDLTKPDTDGDGYNDNIEVQNGYDPLTPPTTQNNTNTDYDIQFNSSLGPEDIESEEWYLNQGATVFSNYNNLSIKALEISNNGLTLNVSTEWGDKKEVTLNIGDETSIFGSIIKIKDIKRGSNNLLEATIFVIK